MTMTLPVYGAVVDTMGRRMPADPDEAPEQETWRDWLPSDESDETDPSELLTREDVIAEVQRRGQGLTVNELRYLEAQGVLPRPVRQWHQGAVRALYPPWICTLIEWVRNYQRNRYPLDQIREWARRAAPAFAHDVPPVALPALPQAEPTGLPVKVQHELRRIAAQHARLTGAPTTAITVRITGADGRTTEYSIDPENPTL
jgi:hypothetical protein